MKIVVLHFVSDLDSAVASRLSRLVRRYLAHPNGRWSRGSAIGEVSLRSLEGDIADPDGLRELAEDLASASFIILLCSVASRESAAYMRVVEDRISEGRGESLLFMITEGDPGASFPKNLVPLLGGKEPMAANVVSGSKRGSLRRLTRLEALRIIAPIAGREYHELKGRLDGRASAKRRLAYALIAVLTAAAIARYLAESYSLDRDISVSNQYRVLNSHLLAKIAESALKEMGSTSTAESAISRMLGSDEESLAIIDEYREEADKEHVLAPYGFGTVQVSSDLTAKLRLRGLLEQRSDPEAKAFFSSLHIREGVEELGARMFARGNSRYLRDIENIASAAGESAAKESAPIKSLARWLLAKLKRIKFAKALRHL